MTKPRSCPCRYGCVSPGEKDQNGDRRHRSVCRETRSAIITLLLRARRFNATLAQGEGVPFAALAEREGVSRSYFTRLVRLSYLAPDITQAILDGAAATRFDGREAPRALTSAACLARSADRARLCLSPIWIRSTHALSTEKTRLCWDRRGIIADHIRGMGYRNMARQRYCRRLAEWKAWRVSGRPGRQASCPDPRGKRGFSTLESGCGRERTVRWRKADSNHRSRSEKSGRSETRASASCIAQPTGAAAKRYRRGRPSGSRRSDHSNTATASELQVRPVG